MISGLPRQADMIARTWHVRLVPKADSPGARYEGAPGGFIWFTKPSGMKIEISATTAGVPVRRLRAVGFRRITGLIPLPQGRVRLFFLEL
jgi:hypothetical protein